MAYDEMIMQAIAQRKQKQNLEAQRAAQSKSSSEGLLGNILGGVIGFVTSGFNPAGAVAGWKAGGSVGRGLSGGGDIGQAGQEVLSGVSQIPAAGKAKTYDYLDATKQRPRLGLRRTALRSSLGDAYRRL